MSAAKAGETWKDPSGDFWVIVGHDVSAGTVNPGGTGWISANLTAQGWTRVAVSPDAIESQLTALQIQLNTLQATVQGLVP